MGYRYIGSKARIADEIIKYIGESKGEGYFIDAFSGTGIVAEKAAEYGWKIKINDMMKNAVIMSEARLLSKDDVQFIEKGGYSETVNYLNGLKGVEGYFWREYSPASKEIVGVERKYYSEDNAKKIDAIAITIREWLASIEITNSEFTLLMASLISAVNDVANIAGTYGCFLSKWTSQSENKLELKTMKLRNQKVKYESSNTDVYEVKSKPEDIVYLDPPYTKRQYASYYHILESLVCGDEPIVEGVSGLRPWKEKASVFCYKRKALKALSKLMIQQKAKRVILSYSNEGHIQLDDLIKEIEPFGSVKIIELSTIGRYTPNKTAVENNLEVKEYLIDYRRK